MINLSVFVGANWSAPLGGLEASETPQSGPPLGPIGTANK